MHHLTTAINNNCHRHYTITPDISKNTYHAQIIRSIFASYRMHAINKLLFCIFGDQFLCVRDMMQDADTVKSLCRSVMTLLGFSVNNKLFLNISFT